MRYGIDSFRSAKVTQYADLKADAVASTSRLQTAEIEDAFMLVSQPHTRSKLRQAVIMSNRPPKRPSRNMMLGHLSTAVQRTAQGVPYVVLELATYPN